MEKKVVKYIEDACPRISIERNNKINHYDSKHSRNNYTAYDVIIETVASIKNEKK